MYNKFLEKYLAYEPEKVISKGGIIVRKIVSPALRFIVPFVTPNSKLSIIRRAKLPKKPLIFAATHGFREDVEHTVVLVKRQAYILNGSLPQVFKTFAGITAWIAGFILADRRDKVSRSAAKKKMIYALELGASIIMYPEGTWNKSPNELISGLFPGIYDVAKESGVLVVPVATFRNDKKAYGIVGEAFNICEYEKKEGLSVLRDKMATMQWEIMEKYAQAKRKELPYGEDADRYWENHIESLMDEVKFYDYEIEQHTKYRPLGITAPEDAFAFADNLIPSKENAFLLRSTEINSNR